MVTKPANVPGGAFWSDDDQEWVLGERDAEGEFQGKVSYYRPDGTLCCVTEFVNGTPHGAFARYHENGEESRTGSFVEGTLHGTNVFLRSTGETTENFPAGLGEQIWRCEMDYDDGRIVEGRLYDRDGRRVMEDGEPFPEARPSGVPADAHFRKPEGADDYRWVSGVTRDDDGTAVRVGTWKYWTAAGVLVREESYVEGELHGAVRLFDEDSGALVGEERYEEGARQFERPDGVPEAADFDDDDDVWVLDAPEEAGLAHGDRCMWSTEGVLLRRETYARGLLELVREYLGDGSLGQESSFFDGGVPRRKWFRRTEDETLDSFPSVLGEHPTAVEVEYLFDGHGMMSGFAIRDAAGADLERAELRRNAANDTDQARFSSLEEASRAWREEGQRYTSAINAWLAELYETGEPSEEEPTFDRDDLERAVLEGVEELNAGGEAARARELFPLYFDGIGGAFWDKYGLVVDRVLHTGPALYARVNSPTGGSEVVRIRDGRVEPVPGVIAFGASHDKKYLAFAHDDRIEVQSGGEAIDLPYPRQYQHAGADALAAGGLKSGRSLGVREIRVLPSGSEVVLVSQEGTYLVSQERTQRLYPLDASMDEYVEQFEEMTAGHDGEHLFDLEVQLASADVSPAGDRITCGGMFRRGILAGLAIYRRGADGSWAVEATSQADAFFPIQAVFHRERPHVAFAACLYASLHYAMPNTTFRIDLDGLEPGELDEFSGGISREQGIVHAIASFGDGFLLGFNNGYVRWMGVEDDLQLLGYVFAGGGIRHIDVSPDQRSFAVVSDAGLVQTFTLGDAPSENLIATMPVRDESRVAFFRTYPPLIW